MTLLGRLSYNARRASAATGFVLLGIGAAANAGVAGAQALTRVVDRPVVHSVKVDGNTHISTTDLKAAIVTRATHSRTIVGVPIPLLKKVERLDRAELDRDLLRLRVLYWKRGWRAAQVVPELVKRDKGGVDLRLKVTEGPPTLIGELRLGPLDSLLDRHDLRPLVTVKVGEPLDLIELDSIAVHITAHLDAEGYGDVMVTPVAMVDADNPRAVVSLEVKKLYITRVEAVRVEGTEHYDPRVVANTMRVKQGDVFSRSGVIESQRALYEAGFFKRAVVRVEAGSADSLKRLVAVVEELQPKSFRVTGGVSTVDFLQLDARYTDANFRSNAGRLSLQGTLGNLLASQFNGQWPFKNVLPKGILLSNSPKYLQPTFQLNADVRRRWLSDSRNQTGLSAFAYRRSSPGVFVDQGGGVGASFTRNVTRTIPLSLQYRLEFTNVSAADTYFCVNFGVCDETSLRVLERTQRLSPLAITASTDRRDDPIGPTRGFTWRAELEYADGWTGSQFGYGRIEVEGSKYFHASEKLTVAVHARAGIVRSTDGAGAVILPRKRFYAGGARSVRGYGENQLGPRVLVIARTRFQPDSATFARYFAVGDTLSGRRLPCDPALSLPECPTEPAGRAPLDTTRRLSDFDDGDFLPKPLGAETMIEGSIEARYRFWGPLTVAAFIDAGAVGAKFGGTPAVFTPGVGVRFTSPVGPIRVDLGYNPRGRENLTVITELAARDASWLPPRTATAGLYQLATTRSFNPANGTGLSGVFDRLTLHLSIGEAF
ncbi:MAG: BamA/TamA family outer membrane protein [Gemmatimonadaceae bacterium]|nr:BamA/TamA family outer membrane protein [Gemmatimonadaceae bacterium]